ncbi:MAG TPA: sugar ABC transporter permease [Thermotogae bacterium]|nr:multiple sugar transport system permease protein [Thermotogota bacterium]HCZ06465.1 sugar ABC transporter permease [Thermotogota bacterium]
MKHRRNLKRYALETLKAYLFLLPSLVVLSIFVFWPIGFSLVLSFFKWDFRHQRNPVFIGWENYRQLFLIESPFSFTLAILVTMIVLFLSILMVLAIYQVFRKKITLWPAVFITLFLTSRLYFPAVERNLLLTLVVLTTFVVLFLIARKTLKKEWTTFTNSPLGSTFLVIVLFVFLRYYAHVTKDIIAYLAVVKESTLFIKAIWNTVYYVILATPTTIFLALGIALLLNRPLKLRSFYRTAYFIPFVTSVVAISLVWKWIFNDEFGLLNYFLSWFGVEKIAWLKDERWTIPTIAIVSIWKTVGYDAVIFLAGLQNIDKFYYEAAEVDGANNLQKFFYITWPLLSPTTFFVLIVSMIGAFKVFTEVYVLYEGLPGPYGNSGLTMVYYIFDTFYQKQRMGLASAAAYVLFAIILVLTLIQFRIGRKRVQYVG